MSAPKRILFLDNRPEFMHQPVLRLRLEGYEVHEATTGEDGFGAIAGQTYDALILDAELPGGDGWRVLKELQEDPNFGDTKVIVLMAGKGETAQLALVPVDAEIRRPFTMAKLIEAVRGVLA